MRVEISTGSGWYSDMAFLFRVLFLGVPGLFLR